MSAEYRLNERIKAAYGADVDFLAEQPRVTFLDSTTIDHDEWAVVASSGHDHTRHVLPIILALALDARLEILVMSSHVRAELCIPFSEGTLQELGSSEHMPYTRDIEHTLSQPGIEMFASWCCS